MAARQEAALRRAGVAGAAGKLMPQQQQQQDWACLDRCLHRAWAPVQEKTPRCLPAAAALGSAEETEATAASAAAGTLAAAAVLRAEGRSVSAGFLPLVGCPINLPRLRQAAQGTWSLTAAAQHSAATAWAPPAIADVLVGTADAARRCREVGLKNSLPARRCRDALDDGQQSRLCSPRIAVGMKDIILC